MQVITANNQSPGQLGTKYKIHNTDNKALALKSLRTSNNNNAARFAAKIGVCQILTTLFMTSVFDPSNVLKTQVSFVTSPLEKVGLLSRDYLFLSIAAAAAARQ